MEKLEDTGITSHVIKILTVSLPSNRWCKMNPNSVKTEATDPLIYKKLAATHIDILSKCEKFSFVFTFDVRRNPPAFWRVPHPNLALSVARQFFSFTTNLPPPSRIIFIERLLKFISITGIGAEVEKKRNSVVEREKQKAIRSTEEVVRREEEAKRLEVSCRIDL